MAMDVIDPDASLYHAQSDGDALEENKFQRAIAVWRNINLSSLAPSLDTVASDLVSQQRDTLVQRKELAQKTKDFRKLDDSEKLAETRSLLKSYQTFIDSLANQSKTTYSAFLQLYSPLSEAPDPYPLLEASVDSLVVAEEVVPKIRTENEQLRKQVSRLTTQVEDVEKRLESETRTRKTVESSRDERISEVEKSWAAVLQEKDDNWQAREQASEEKVANQERLLKELKANLEVSQRLSRAEEGVGGEADGHDGIGRSATTAELELVHSELDRANTRLAAVEARNEQLRTDLARTASTVTSIVAVEDDPAFLQLRTQNSSLLRKLEAAKMDKQAEIGSLQSGLRALERELASLRQDSRLYKEKLEKRGDYEEIKKELEILRAVEFASGSDFRDGEAREEGLGERSGQKESLEHLLLARNKKLNDELTVLRVSHQELKTRTQRLEQEVSSSRAELEKAEALANRLENDLLRSSTSMGGMGGGAAASVAGSRYGSMRDSRRGQQARAVSPTSSIMSGMEGSRGSDAYGSFGAGVGAGAGILPMVSAQRDRFKKRNCELESEVSKCRQSIAALRTEVATLQRDNVSLYEKSRYASTFQRGGTVADSVPGADASHHHHQQQQQQQQQYRYGRAGSSGSMRSPGLTGPAQASLPAADHRYRAAYEQKISPFTAFRGQESARAIRRMPVPERLVLHVTRLVLSSRASRNLFAAYSLALHCLLFVLFYYLAVACGPGVGVGVGAVAGPTGGRRSAGLTSRSGAGGGAAAAGVGDAG